MPHFPESRKKAGLTLALQKYRPTLIIIDRRTSGFDRAIGICDSSDGGPAYQQKRTSPALFSTLKLSVSTWIKTFARREGILAS